MSPDKKVLFIVPYPLHRAPSQRFRVELYLPLFSRHRIDYHIEPFLDEQTFSQLYKEGGMLKKAFGVLRGFLRRFYVVLFTLQRYDYVFVHREASPLGPPVFEWMIAKLFRKRLIYDFDDAIWISDSTNKVLNSIKAYWKTKKICSWAYKIAGGNEYLCQYAANYNNSVVLLPTCVDVQNGHNQLKRQETEKVVIGWTGSHSTLKYLDAIFPVLKRVTALENVEVLIIGNKPPVMHLPEMRFIHWKEESEIEDLLQINIGIMPLEKDQWSEGKCGFKIIQYLSLGIPAVASPVGVNTEIIEQGKNGFLCTKLEEWENALVYLVNNVEVRKQLGLDGQKKIASTYSIQANEAVFFSLFG